MSAAVLHIDLDSFFVSCERLEDPSLIGKPVVIGSKSGRGVISSASYEARQFGVRSAMTMKKALELCPLLVAVPGNMPLYSEKSREVTQLLLARAPLLEKASVDEHYIDVSGMERFHDTWTWCKELRADLIRLTGLPMSIGLSTNKTMAKMATNEGKPNGTRYVPASSVRAFLDPLPIEKIPGLGKKTVPRIKALGIHTIGQLAAQSPSFFLAHFGNWGSSLQEKALGIHQGDIHPFHRQRSMSHERTFRENVTDPKTIESTIAHLSEKLGFQLRKKGQCTGTVGIKIRYADFETHTLEVSVTPTNADHLLLERALALYDKVKDRQNPIRLIGVKASGLTPAPQQLELFSPQEKYNRLYAEMDHLKERFGDTIVQKAKSLG